jgi:hypothetical protein
MSMNVAHIQINVQKGLMIEHLILKNCVMFFFRVSNGMLLFVCDYGHGEKVSNKKNSRC